MSIQPSRAREVEIECTIRSSVGDWSISVRFDEDSKRVELGDMIVSAVVITPRVIQFFAVDEFEKRVLADYRWRIERPTGEATVVRRGYIGNVDGEHSEDTNRGSCRPLDKLRKH